METGTKRTQTASRTARIRDGFPGQRLRVLPRPVVQDALTRPLSCGLVVTDCGYFPHATDHGRTRRHGAEQAIVIVCVEGGGWVRTPDRELLVRPGQVAVIPPGCPHTYGAEDTDPWTIWWVHLAGTEVAPALERLEITDAAVSFPVDNGYHLADLVDEALGWLERDDTATHVLAASGAAFHLLTALVAGRRIHTDEVAAARDYLRHRVGQRVPVSQLAARASLSTSHFAALFKKETGYGVLEYQVRLRLSRAQTLLDTTSLTIAQVAAAVGYRDPLYFSRQFRSVYQVSPSEYRASHKG